jgi:SAM-dependent methyltransferase
MSGGHLRERRLIPLVQRLYDVIGDGYAATRRTEPRIAARIWQGLGDARTVLNVGAGAGSYEPPGRDVVAVEPSAVMRAQRPPRAAPCLAADAGSLPFRDHSFDAAMAVLSDQHWPDPIAGLHEMRRVARRVVVFQFDASHPERFWLTRDYLPEFARLGQRPLAGGTGPGDRGADRAGADPVGLPGRLLPRLLAAPGGLPAG